jgi:poly-gamma-glutamate synthesis protein (capsule biosynthesis protein)
MIFSGDVVFPNAYTDNVLDDSDSDFWIEPKIANLESSIFIRDTKIHTKGIALCSHPGVTSFLESLNIKCVSLANNHIFDYDIDIEQQIYLLKKRGITSIGAGSNLTNSCTAFHHNKSDLVAVSFGWNVIRCKYATNETAGVNPYEYKWVKTVLLNLRKTYPLSKLVAIFHWNYEFELYPQPADREFAHHLIDLGVDAIVGHHSHIIQGFEIYKGKPIFYGLGNCYFPNGEYGGFNLNFPEEANKGLSVSLLNNEVKVYITQLKDNKQLSVIKEGHPSEIEELMDASGFQGMSHNDYINYFSLNRKKKKMLPIYRSYKDDLLNYFYDKYVMYRQVPVDLLSKLRGGSR